MSKITLNFFGESIVVDKPKSLSSLRNDISQLFCLSSQDAAEIILTYKKNGEKQNILDDENLKTFLNSGSTLIDLDISQSSQLYKNSLNKLQEENSLDKKTLEELLKKKKELSDLKEKKFEAEKKEIKEIEAKIMELLRKKNEIRKKIFEGMQQIDKSLKENDQKIQELQKKLFGTTSQKPEKEKMKRHIIPRFAPPFLHPPSTNHFLRVIPPSFIQKKYQYQPNQNKLKANPHPSPHVHPCFFPRKYHIQPNQNKLKANPHPSPHVHPCFFPRKYHIQPNQNKLKVKFAKTEYIDIPKDTSNTINETTDSNEDLDLKMRTIDDWGNCLLLKTKEITNRLTEKFKGLQTLKISKELFGEEKEENSKKDEEIKLKSGKNLKLNVNAEFQKSSSGKRPEGVPKKFHHCPTMGNILEKEKISNKIMHFGVKCDQCGQYPIIGCRYKCSVCSNFDFCEECEKKYSKMHNHAFFKISNPSMRNLIFKNLPKNK